MVGSSGITSTKEPRAYPSDATSRPRDCEPACAAGWLYFPTNPQARGSRLDDMIGHDLSSSASSSGTTDLRTRLIPTNEWSEAPHQMTSGRRWHARALLYGALGLTCGATGLSLALEHPLWPWGASVLFVAAAMGFALRPAAWLLVLPTLLPIIGLAPWTGWITFEEWDLLVLAIAAGGYVRRAWPHRRLAPRPGLQGSSEGVHRCLSYSGSSSLPARRCCPWPAASLTLAASSSASSRAIGNQ